MKGIEAEEDCAPLRAQRFFQNWNEESVVREIEDFFFTTNSNILVPQTLVALPVRKKLRSPEFKKDTSLQLNKSSDHSATARRTKNMPTSNRGEAAKIAVRETVK